MSRKSQAFNIEQKIICFCKINKNTYTLQKVTMQKCNEMYQLQYTIKIHYLQLHMSVINYMNQFITIHCKKVYKNSVYNPCYEIQ